jgi:basic membrane lipoprotein Med (substrate-binding protein (PBP1-ABC) superfamily)
MDFNRWLPLLAALVIVGCTNTGGTSEGTNSNADSAHSAKTKTLKVALLTPGPVSDSGWSALAYDGLKAIEQDMGAQINSQEATGPKIRDAMRSYAQQGYNLIFGHGYEYNSIGVEVAKDFPETVFVSSSGGETSANAGAFRFYLEQGFYLAGNLAAQMSKSGKIAMIGGDDVPSIRSTFKAFKAGALAANSKVVVIEVFTGSGSDIAKAKQATVQAIDQGADFVIHQANAAAQGVFDAAKERNVLVFGANLNQNDNASGVVLASAVIQAKPAFLEIAKKIAAGEFKGGIELVGMEQGAIDFIINPALKEKIPADVLQNIESLQEDIRSGSLTVPKDEF